MTKEQREAYRPVLEAWLDGELEFAEDGKNWSRWDSKWPPVCNWPPDHYRRKPKPRVVYGWIDSVRLGILNTETDGVYETKEDAMRRGKREGKVLFRCEEVIE